MKKLVLIIIGLHFIAHITEAQIPQWQKSFGGSQDDVAHVSVQTADHGYIIGGTSESGIGGNKTESSYGNQDYWILKLDSTGNLQWQKDFGGNADDNLLDIIQTSDGGYLLGGISNSGISGTKTEANFGSYDLWIIKLDNSGTVEWDRTFGTTWYDLNTSVLQTMDGGYLIGGDAEGVSGNKTSAGIGDLDCWLIKLDNAGVVEWQKTIGGFNDDEIRDMELTSDGGLVVLSYSGSDISGDKTEDGYGGMDYWIIKLDSLYNIQWDKTYGGDGDEFSHSIEQTTDGGFIVAGSSLSIISGNKTTPGDGVALLGWLVKIDASGNNQWQNNFGGNIVEHLLYAHQVPDGGYILGIDADSHIAGNKTDPQQGYWVVKTDASGYCQWQNAMGVGCINGSQLACLSLTDDGGYLLSGHSACPMSADKTEPDYGGADYWIIKVADNLNTIGGSLFLDANNNQLQDAGEQVIPGKTILETTTGAIAFSQPDGQYDAKVNGPGTFTVAPLPALHYTSAPLNHTVSFSGIQQSSPSNDFAYHNTGSADDLEVAISPSTGFRPGYNAVYFINFINSGTTTLNGTVTFYPDNLISFYSSSLTPQLVTADSIIWNVGTLMPFQSGAIGINVNVPSSVGIGTLINSMARISPIANDFIPGNNQSAWVVTTTGSVDPNAILVDQVELETTQLSNPPYLEYIIFFQNTGTDTAFNIAVVNPVDNERVNLETFELVSSSFPVNIEYVAWEQNLKFHFNNIQLPDSNINEPASHGFIRYRIKPKSTLLAGDSITNTAFIYFDYNEPVQTNVATTKIVLASGFASVQPAPREFILYPNPSDGRFVIRNNGKLLNYDITVTDILGNTIIETKMNSASHTMDLSGNDAGIYFLSVKSSNGIMSKKLVLSR